MRYLGGKAKKARKIVEAIGARPGDLVMDLFCGSLAVSAAFARAGCRVWSSDSHAALIAMWRGARAGKLPASVEDSPEAYHRARALPDSDPVKALYGFGGSFGGVYFGAYSKPAKYTSGKPRSYVNECIRPVMRDAHLPEHVEHADFFDYPITSVDLVYLDPPYAGTKQYSCGPFDHARFWARAAEWARAGVRVVVSEYTAPAGWVSTCSWVQKVRVGGAGFRTEHLWEYRP